MAKEYTLANYFGLENIDKDTDTEKLKKNLKDLTRTIDNATKIYEPDNSDFQDAIYNIEYYSSDVDDAINIIEEFEYALTTIDYLLGELDSRLTDEERQDFEEERLLRRLKGK